MPAYSQKYPKPRMDAMKRLWNWWSLKCTQAWGELLKMKRNP